MLGYNKILVRYIVEGTRLGDAYYKSPGKEQYTIGGGYILYRNVLYFAWEDQSEKVCCIDHKVVINCITVLYEPYSTVICS